MIEEREGADLVRGEWGHERGGGGWEGWKERVDGVQFLEQESLVVERGEGAAWSQAWMVISGTGLSG